MFLAQYEGRNITNIQNKTQDYISVCLNLYIFGKETWKTKEFAPKDSKRYLTSAAVDFFLNLNTAFLSKELLSVFIL